MGRLKIIKKQQKNLLKIEDIIIDGGYLKTNFVVIYRNTMI
jgi:hypothetical protein